MEIIEFEGVRLNAMLEETKQLLKLAALTLNLKEFIKKSKDALPYKTAKAKLNHINAIKDRYLELKGEEILLTPLLKLISNEKVAEKIKDEVLFYHLTRSEPIVKEIMYYIYNFLPAKKEISLEEFRRSAYLLMDKKAQDIVAKLLDNLTNFKLISKEEGKIKFDYYSVSWQSFIYALLHFFNKKTVITFEEILNSLIPRIYLLNLVNIKEYLMVARNSWLLRPAGKGQKNKIYLLTSLDKFIDYLDSIPSTF